MALPITLPNGVVAIYGSGSFTGSNGITPPFGYYWGTVNSVFAGGETYIYNGDSILYKDEDVVVKLAYDNATYTLVNINKDFIIKEDSAP